ncbi:MAG: ComF family protein [Gammaproteobacteria bacterium]|nr:ComF family protein [Gammaproteobacteria bacterium]NNF62242.1 ComF family protein [Gammaproteobacteria bacterium]NNM21039.1 ComF family protein [Gammaproteobacteria bacterium]
MPDTTQFTTRLGEWLMPPRCVVCGGRGNNRDLCRHCAVELPWNLPCCLRCALPLATGGLCGECAVRPPLWHRAHAPLRYEFPVDSLLRQLKFQRRLAHGRVLGELLAQWVASFDDALPELIVPTPLHWRRQLLRRFNQADEIARPLQRQLDVPVVAACSRRIATPPQRGLKAAQRRRNLRHAFAVRQPVRGRHVALVDDIFTTGATLAELTRVLLRAGAARVDVWTIARVAK